MENCVSDVRVWLAGNKLKLNDAKTECIVMSGVSSDTPTVHIEKEVIIPANSVCNLGAVIDSQLTMEAYLHLRLMLPFRSILLRKHVPKSSIRRLRQNLRKPIGIRDDL